MLALHAAIVRALSEKLVEEEDISVSDAENLVADCFKNDMKRMKQENHLATLPQYHFDRNDFVMAFRKVFTTDQIYDLMDKCNCRENSDYFMFFRDGDEFYIVHMDSGTIINWYKHLGRTNTCNKEGFGLEDLDEFLRLIKKDLDW